MRRKLNSDDNDGYTGECNRVAILNCRAYLVMDRHLNLHRQLPLHRQLRWREDSSLSQTKLECQRSQFFMNVLSRPQMTSLRRPQMASWNSSRLRKAPNPKTSQLLDLLRSPILFVQTAVQICKARWLHCSTHILKRNGRPMKKWISGRGNGYQGVK